MFESISEKIVVSINRGTNFGTYTFETEIQHRVPPSDEGWCLFLGRLAWWDGQKGVSVSLIFGENRALSDLLGRGAGYKALTKFHLPQLSKLSEIHCEDEKGLMDRCWLRSRPIPVERVVVEVSLHRNWTHLYFTQHKSKILGKSPTLELNSVDTDPLVFDSLVNSILGRF